MIDNSENANQVNELNGIVRQAKEEHTQLLQYYRKIYRISLDHQNTIVDDDTRQEIHEWLLFALFSYRTISQKLSSFKKLSQDVSWGLVKDILSSLQEEMYKKIQPHTLVSQHHLPVEDISTMEDDLPLLVNLLDIGGDQVDQVQQLCLVDEEEEDFLIPVQELQRVCKSISDVCDTFTVQENTTHGDIDEEAIMVQRAESIKRDLSAYQILAPKLKETEEVNTSLASKLRDSQEQLRQVSSNRTNMEKEIRTLRTKQDEQLRQQEEITQGYKREIDKLKQSEQTYQEAIDTLQYEISLIETQNKELREKRSDESVIATETELKMPSPHPHHHDIIQHRQRGDYLDKSELEALKSTIQWMRRKQFDERARRNEIAMIKLFASETRDKKDMMALKKRVGYTKALADSAKQYKSSGVLSVINLQNNADHQWLSIKQKSISWAEQRVATMKTIASLL
jgi:uncharacterized phage infection (PIP) family protein YhgE